MIKSVLLIRPKAEGKVEFPFGLIYVGTSLKRQGFNVKIFDLHIDPDQEKDILDFIDADPNVIIGIGALSGSYLWVKNFTRTIKTRFPGIDIVIGGHIAILYKLLLTKTGIDYVCTFEGEEMFPALLNKINNKQNNFKEIPGVAYLDKLNNEIIRTRRKLIPDWNLPDFSLIEIDRYFMHPSQDRFFARDPRYMVRAKDNDRMATVMFSRGCKGVCNFCYRHLPGYRQGKLEWCWEYLMSLYRDFNVKYFRIDDELFTFDKDWFNGFYKMVMDKNIDILFRISGQRGDSVDEELLKKLSEMGCIAVNYGLESGSQKILNSMNKRVTVSQNINAVNATRKLGMQVMAYIMLGYEGETQETLTETLNMLLKIDIEAEDISVFYAMPLPGTKLYCDCIKKGLIADEKKYIVEISKTVADQYGRYIIQLGDVTRDELRGFEAKMLFLVGLKKIFKAEAIGFKVIKWLVFVVPNKSKINYMFKILQKIMGKFQVYKNRYRTRS